MQRIENKGPNGWALVPLLIFVGLMIGTGAIMSSAGVEKPFHQLPASAALFMAVIAAFIIYRDPIEKKVGSFIHGCTNENILIMVLTVLLAGAFSEVAGAMGGVESFVNLALTFMPPSLLIAGFFIICSLMSLATGTSSGTVAALAPIALSIGQVADLNMAMLFAAVLGGAFFGDNLSIISDTTIVVTRGQGVAMKDKFRVNLWIALPAMIVTVILFLIFGGQETAAALEIGEYSVIKVLPYIFVLLFAVLGGNVFVVLTSGIILSGLVGIFHGDLTFITLNQSIFTGFEGMLEIIVLALFIGGLSQMMNDGGGLQFIIDKVTKRVKGKKTAELGIIGMVSLTDVAVANNTAALIATNDIAKEITEEYKVDPRRTAAIMDIFSSVTQGLLPYGNQILLLVGIAGGIVSPLEIIPYMWYVMLLGVFGIISIYIPFADRVIKKEPWVWDKEDVTAESKIIVDKPIIKTKSASTV
ncbi:Na+/H+ antiporter NhaC family protein [Sporosarcina sp. G11-34]|uniref:Na+/H+ antiporter NhaC family protein n=1 Tax=Sporosarcina sp. G11-34 TaxID=2849605 RepID=UPI0022A91B96|nr:Na+/H+ antiporter NhaC family protein [Sporosarcina sp. G11-34]MCZ2258596.1 Na+/H+ antiporter NhaC family protein [Sporosarcina sp. G11-34]